MSSKDTSQQKSVTLYVVHGCPLCTHARAWLNQHDIKFVERDVANDFGALRAMYRLTKQRLVPVFEVQGRALVRPGEAELMEMIFPHGTK